MNRSGALAIAYVMLHGVDGVSDLESPETGIKRTPIPVLDAVEHCAKRRGPILYNASFQRQVAALAIRESAV